MSAIVSREQSLHPALASDSACPQMAPGAPLFAWSSPPHSPHACPVRAASLHVAAVRNCLGNSTHLATQMSDAGSCPKGRRTRTVNKDLGVLHFGAPAVSFTLFTLNYSGSALSNYIWSTPATSHSCSTTTLMTTSVIQRERVKTHL